MAGQRRTLVEGQLNISLLSDSCIGPAGSGDALYRVSPWVFGELVLLVRAP